MRDEVLQLFRDIDDLTPAERRRYFDRHQVPADLQAELESLLQFDSADAPLADLISGAAQDFMEGLEKFPAPGLHCGPYRLLDVVGSGGMGAVYLAERADGEVTQRLAIKLLPPGAGDWLRERFLQERQIQASLTHPNIARMLDAGRLENGQPFLAMEYVRGQPIDVFAAGFTLRQKILLFLKVCSAVAYLHRNLIIHRDLKPTNILVTEEGEPKLLDFGIAKMLDRATDATVTSMRMLTPDYASPEQVTAGRISTATDIYSLGAVFYRLLTGKPPHEFDDRSPEGVARIVAMREVTRPSRWSPELKGDLESILLKTLRKDPQERYATVEQLADDLQAFLEFRTVRARSGNAWYRTRRFVRRYWIPVTATAVVFASLSVGLYVANRERGRANQEAATAKAVNDFLQRDLLAQASAFNQKSPNIKPDPDLKVRTALDRAAAHISGNFAKQPLVEAAIRQTIANAYRDLSLYQQAEMHLGRALELRRGVQGDQHPDTLSVMDDLAAVYFFEGKFAPAQSLDAKVQAIRRRVLGEEDPATLNSMMNLASVDERMGQYAAAEPIASKALEISRRVLGEEHHGTMSAMYALAVVYASEGKYAQAEAFDTSLVEMEKRVLGEENPETVRVMNNLATVYNAEGKFQQAEALQLQVLEIQRRVLGAEHMDTLIGMNNLATTYLAERKYAQAAPILEEALVPDRRVLGEEHPFTLVLMGNLAVAYFYQAKYAEAEPLYAKVLEVRRRVLGPLHPDTTTALTAFSQLELREHRYGDAERLLREALNTLEKTRPGDWRRYSAESLLGAALNGQQRYAEAEQLLLSGYAGLIERKDTMPSTSKSRVAETGEQIVQLYRAWGKPEKADAWQARLAKESGDGVQTALK